MNLFQELSWRGMLQDYTPGVEKLLGTPEISAYVGFDPTAPSLHIGNLVPIMLLAHVQRAGFTPIALVGGATGRIGDPSGKSSERTLLNEEVLVENQKAIQKQLAYFLKFEGVPNPAILLNNYDWFGKMNFLDFLRNIGKHLSVSYMISKESVQKRLETGISFTEFSYQLLQGYDFRFLYENYHCRLQLGGADQWGNMTTGLELIRRMSDNPESLEPAHVITTPLLTKADGSKYGKSESGNIWLDSNLTSPYKFYQFFLQTEDSFLDRLLKTFTFLSKEEINSLLQEHQQAPHLRKAQKVLAADLTRRVHGEDALQLAITASNILFGEQPLDMLANLSDSTFAEVFEGVSQTQLAKSRLDADFSIIDLLTELRVVPSRSEAKKLLKANAIRINKQKVSEDCSLNRSYLIRNQFILVQKGKREYYLAIFN
ncbi:MAG: tyrosine--tRNA ligase [Bacteroidia bacterium]|nr:tyrosine--tRNA ligase [Bacteroidia bacterium]